MKTIDKRMDKIKVIKKNDVLANYDNKKILSAISKSANRVMAKITEDKEKELCNRIVDIITEGNQYKSSEGEYIVPVFNMHDIVTKSLEDVGLYSIAKSYRDYRNYKVDFVSMLDKVLEKAQSLSYIGDVSNANTDSAMISTQRSLIYGELNKTLYQKFFLNKEENQAIKDGFIYIHDMKDRRDGVNCCLALIDHILDGGFEMGNVWYNEPKTLDVAFDVISDIVMSMASQQYGK